MDQNGKNKNLEQVNAKIAGWILVVIALLSSFAMVQHPYIQAQEISAQVSEVIRKMAVNQLVHGSLIFMVGLYFLVFLIYSRIRGLAKLSILIGICAYAIGSIAMMGAALLNGFAAPNLAATFEFASPEQLENLGVILRFSWSASQALAYTGVFAVFVAIISWSVELLNTGRIKHTFALLGLFVGIGTPIMLISGHIGLDVHGMLAVLITQNIWYLCIAYLLVSNSIFEGIEF